MLLVAACSERDRHTKNGVCGAEVERGRRGDIFVWQHAGVILSCLCKLGETHRLQSRRSNTSVCQYEREVSEQRRGLGVCVSGI